MSYSPLVSYYVKSPNYDPRGSHKVRGFAIHCFPGQITVERGVNAFRNPRDASCNYVVGTDGRIGCAVDDENRSWCTSTELDYDLITIEMATDSFHPYAVNDDAYEAMIKLLVDRCKAHGIKRLAWAGDPDYARDFNLSENYQNLVAHRWFAAKACPGDWIYDREGEIAAEVNRRLGSAEPEPAPEPDPEPAPAPEPEPEYTTTITIRNLGIGDHGNDVRALQGILEANGHDLAWCGGADGIFGDGTEEAVENYQIAHGLDVDGVVGPDTWGHLLKA